MQAEPEDFGARSSMPEVMVEPDTDPEGKPDLDHSAYTEQRHQQFCAAIAGGNYVEVAAGLIGVHRNTVYRWMDWGREGREPFSRFVADVEQAMALCEANDVAVIDRAAKTDPKWAAWRLERRNRKRWAPQREKDEKGDSNEPIRIQLEWGPKPEPVESSRQSALNRGVDTGEVDEAVVVPPDEQ